MSTFAEEKKQAAQRGDVSALFAIAEREREAQEDAVRERARELGDAIKCDERETVKLQSIRIEHVQVLSEKAEKMRRCADALTDAGEEQSVAAFNVSSVDLRLASLHDRLTANRRSLSKLIDGIT